MIANAGDNSGPPVKPAPMVEAHFRPAASPAVLGTPVFVNFEYRNVTRDVLSFAIGSTEREGFRFLPRAPGVGRRRPYRELGGLEPVIELGPGEAGALPVLLNRYLCFRLPGRYSIKAQIDLELRDCRLTVVGCQRVEQLFDLELIEQPATALETLHRLERDALEGSPSVDLKAIDVLGALCSDGAVQILAKVLEQDDEPLIEAALAALGGCGVAASLAVLDRFIAATASPRLRDLGRGARRAATVK